MQKNGVDQHYIYVMLSQTPTGFGRLIRKVMGYTYNHTSIAFDEEFRELYGMGRKVHNVPVNAGLVREYPERFTLNQCDNVPVLIYRIPVTKEQYDRGYARLHEIMEDEEGYLYNLYSALTYPLFRGFGTYKAYTCSEFVAHMLKLMEVPVNMVKDTSYYTPNHMPELLEGFEVYYKGNLLDYVTDLSEHNPLYFQYPGHMSAGKDTICILGKLVYRRCGYLFSSLL